MKHQVGQNKGRLLAGLELHLTVQAIGQGPGLQPQRLQAHRQQQLPLPRRGIQQHGHGLETAVQQAPVLPPLWSFQLRPGLAISPQELPQAPVGGAIVQPSLGQVFVEPRQLHRGRRHRWLGQREGRLCRWGFLQDHLPMTLPGRGFGPIRAAMEGEAIGPPVTLQPHGSAVAGQLQRLIEMHRPQPQRLPGLLKQCQRRRDEAGSGEHHLAANAVITQIRALTAQEGLMHLHLAGEIEPGEGSRGGGHPTGGRGCSGDQGGTGRGGEAEMVEPGAGRSRPFTLTAPPVTLSLEGIARQADAPKGVGAVETGPVNGAATAPQAAETGADHLPVGLPRHEGRPVAEGGFLGALTGHANQGGAGANLQKHLGPLGHEGGHPLRKAHRAEHLIAPVVGLGHLGPGQQTGEVADQRPAGRCKGQLPQFALEGFQHRSHRLGVKGMGHRQLARMQSGPLRLSQQLPQGDGTHGQAQFFPQAKGRAAQRVILAGLFFRGEDRAQIALDQSFDPSGQTRTNTFPLRAIQELSGQYFNQRLAGFRTGLELRHLRDIAKPRRHIGRMGIGPGHGMLRRQRKSLILRGFQHGNAARNFRAQGTARRTQHHAAFFFLHRRAIGFKQETLHIADRMAFHDHFPTPRDGGKQFLIAFIKRTNQMRRAAVHKACCQAFMKRV